MKPSSKLCLILCALIVAFQMGRFSKRPKTRFVYCSGYMAMHGTNGFAWSTNSEYYEYTKSPTNSHFSNWPTNPPPGWEVVTDGNVWGARPEGLDMLVTTEIEPPHFTIMNRSGAVVRAWQQYHYGTNEPVRRSRFKTQ